MYKTAGESTPSPGSHLTFQSFFTFTLTSSSSCLCFVQIVFTERNYRKRVERSSTEAKAFFTSLPKWFHFLISKAEINQRHDKINPNQIQSNPLHLPQRNCNEISENCVKIQATKWVSATARQANSNPISFVHCPLEFSTTKLCKKYSSNEQKQTSRFN